MKPPITHERCSELLGDYVTGELSSDERSLVDDHLTDCADCAAERDALIALTAPEVQPLTDGERAELRASVLAAVPASDSSTLLADESDAVIVPIGGWRSKATKYVGIAATLAILAVGFAYIGSMTTGGDDAGQGAQGGDAENDLSNAESGGGAGDQGATRSAPAQGNALDSTAEEDSQAKKLRSGRLSMNYFLASEPAPEFEDDQGDLTLGALDELSRRPVFRSFSEIYTVRQARLSINPSVAALAEIAPSDLAPAVNNCGHTAARDLADPGLLAYATTGRVDERNSLILGFVTGRRSLDHYRLVTFQLGDCRTIVRSLGGPIP